MTRPTGDKPWPPRSDQEYRQGVQSALGEELAPRGILVNAIAPSILDTPPNRKAMPDADFALWPKVDEVAATIAYLASDENKVTRSSVVSVYGKS